MNVPNVAAQPMPTLLRLETLIRLRWLAIVGQAADMAEHLVIVGHDPGRSGLVAGLCTSGDLRLNLHMPSAGLAALAAQIVHWRQLRWGCAELLGYAAPRYLTGLA